MLPNGVVSRDNLVGRGCYGMTTYSQCMLANGQVDPRQRIRDLIRIPFDARACIFMFSQGMLSILALIARRSKLREAFVNIPYNYFC